MGRESACDLFYRLPCVLAMESECHSVSLRDCRDMSSQVARRRDRSHTLTGATDNTGSISDKVSAIDVSAVISFEQEPENHQYYRVFPAVRDDIVAEHTAATQTLQRPRGLAGERSAYVHNSIAALAAKSPIT